MLNQLIQEIQTITRKQSIYDKAQIIAASRSIHRSSCSNIWCVESEKVKGKFYCVQYIEGELMCDCPAFTFEMTNPCKHILSIAIRERGCLSCIR